MDGGGGAVNAPAHGPEPREPAPVLITEAAPSYEDQLASRKRKYIIMMSCRIPCLILAGIFYETWWLALALIAISVPLPWMAVLVANDRPPRKSEAVNKFQAEPTRLEAGDHKIIEGN